MSTVHGVLTIGCVTAMLELRVSEDFSPTKRWQRAAHLLL